MGRITAIGFLLAAACGLGAASGALADDSADVKDAMARYEVAMAATASQRPPVVSERAAGGQRNWLDMTRDLAPFDTAQAGGVSSSQPASQPATRLGIDSYTPQGYVPWQQRYGMAYPNNFWFSLGRYGQEFPVTLWSDTVATAESPVTWVAFALAGAAGLSLANDGGDNQIARTEIRHGNTLNSFWDSVGDAGGNPGTHFAIAGAWFLTSMAFNDSDNYEKSSTMLHALALNGLVTEALKVCTNTHSPNGDGYAWPSGHTSSSFTVATVLYEEYGPWVGVPAYAFAGFVGWERVDSRRHNFSDVISGALIGAAIGHSVAQNHMHRISGFTIVPYVDPDRGGVGLGLAKAW